MKVRTERERRFAKKMTQITGRYESITKALNLIEKLEKENNEKPSRSKKR